jgi:hypothetical protein
MSNLRHYALCFILALYGCAPPPPPVVPPTTATGSGGSSATGVTYTVVVNPVGPPKWTYTVTGKSTSPFGIQFNSVQVHALSDISKCDVSAFPIPSSAHVVFRPAKTDVTITSQPTTPAAWWTGITFSLECDKTNGNVHLFFIQGTQTGQNVGVVVGPIAGPQ